MMDLNIARKNGEVAKTVKVPWTVACPVICGAFGAACGAIGGMLGGFIGGVYRDCKELIKKE